MKTLVMLATSLLLNLGLALNIYRTSAFFSDTPSRWREDSLYADGVIVFADKAKQPDPKSWVQYYSFTVTKYKDGPRCTGHEEVLISAAHIRTPLSEPECVVLHVDFESKTASIEMAGCVFSVAGANTTPSFICKRGGDVGTLGSHLHMFYAQLPFGI